MFHDLTLWCLMASSVLTGNPAAAACGKVMHLHQGYAVCRFDPARSDIRIHHRGRDGRPYGGFENCRVICGRKANTWNSR